MVQGCELLFQGGIGLTPDGEVFDKIPGIGVTKKEQMDPTQRKVLAAGMMKMWADFGGIPHRRRAPAVLTGGPRR
jgi:hypothetical protein